MENSDRNKGSATCSWCIVQYWFDSGHEHRVLIKSHGNSKKHKQSFCRTHPSTMKALKEEVQSHPPKQAINVVYEEKGGMMGAKRWREWPTKARAMMQRRGVRKIKIR